MSDGPTPKSVCIVVPAFDEQANVGVLAEGVRDVMDGLERYDWQLVFVDDGSTDGTLGRLRVLAADDPRVGYVSLSRNFGHQAALKAGVDHADTDCLISMDADMQHPPELLPRLLELWEAGNDVVDTVRRDAEVAGTVKRLTSRWFYRIFNFLSDLELHHGAADFRLLDRRVVDVIRDLPESELFLRGMVEWVGFRHASVEYEANERHVGASKYSLVKMLRFAADGVLAFSSKPLRLASILGFCVSAFAAVYGVYALLVHFSGAGTISGWTSLILTVLLLGGVQLLTIGLLGEYLARTLAETKRRPVYIVAEMRLAPGARARVASAVAASADAVAGAAE